MSRPELPLFVQSLNFIKMLMTCCNIARGIQMAVAYLITALFSIKYANMLYGEITFILKLTAEDTTTDNRVVLFSHEVESLYRGALIEDYNEDLRDAFDVMFKRYETVRKNIDDRITLIASVSMVSPFLVRPITKYLRKSTAKEFLFDQNF